MRPATNAPAGIGARPTSMTARCACGQTRIELHGPPIASVLCDCDDCRAGGRMIEARGGERGVLRTDGSTHLVLFRHDRTEPNVSAGLVPLKLDPGSPTSRNVAACCDTPMLVTFDRGPFWVSVFASAFVGQAPAPRMRIQTRFRPDAPPDDGLPAFRGYPTRLRWRLLTTWIAMRLGR